MTHRLYVGSVMHRRLQPKPYRLRHSAFWLVIDLDETETHRRPLLFSRNRFNALSFHDRDHGAQTDEPLRRQVERHLRNAGIDLEGGRIELLCMPRVFGYGFNPLSIYFCYRRDGAPTALLYEVRNTFGERHSYLLPVEGSAAMPVRQSCDKAFYVSPFMDMRVRYDFRVSMTSERVDVHVNASPHLVAALCGTRAALTDRVIVGLLVRIPLMTLKVIGAIHWHAVRMWWKGFALKPRPPAPEQPLTTAAAHSTARPASDEMSCASNLRRD
jgi:uncharacterized protein